MNKTFLVIGGLGLALFAFLFMRRGQTVVSGPMQTAPAINPLSYNYQPFMPSQNAAGVPIAQNLSSVPGVGTSGGSGCGCSDCGDCGGGSKLLVSSLPKLLALPKIDQWASTIRGWYAQIGRQNPDQQGVDYWANELRSGARNSSDEYHVFLNSATGYTGSSDPTVAAAALNARKLIG